MGLKDDIDNARRTHDIRDVLSTQKKYIVCPLPQHIHRKNTPSFMIFFRDGVQYFRCHGNCGLTGDVIDLVGYLRLSGYDRKDGKMVREALAILENRFEAKIVIPEKQPTLSSSAWIEFLPPGKPVVEYAAKRGLTPETLNKFNVGQRGQFMTMPAFEEQRLVGIKCRNTTDQGIRFYQIEGSRQAMFNYDRVEFQTGVVFVVKGEIPCMLMDQLGFLACAPTGGEGGWRQDWRTALALAHCVYIGDNDETGRRYGERRAAILSALLKFPPGAFKDLDEWILADRENALRELNLWTEEAKKSF